MFLNKQTLTVSRQCFARKVKHKLYLTQKLSGHNLKMPKKILVPSLRKIILLGNWL